MESNFQPSGNEDRISQAGAPESLHLAAEDGDVETIKEILARHTTEEHYSLFSSANESMQGELPLHSAARCGHLDALELLLPESSNHSNDLTNAQTKDGCWSAMHLAAIGGHITVVKWLVEHRKADVNLQDEEGFTPLHLAVALGHKEIVRHLVSQGANLFILDINKMFPASFCKDSSMFDALLSNYLKHSSPSFNTAISQRDGDVDAEKRTYLHYAAEYGSDANVIARLISEAEADRLFAKDKHGDTFLHVAAKFGNMKVLQSIKKLFHPAYIDMACLFNNGKALLLNNIGELDPLNSPGMYALFYNHREFFDELVTLSNVVITLSSIIEKLKGELIDKPEIHPRLDLFGSTLPTYLALYAKKNCIFDFLLETNIISLSQWDDKYNRTCLHWAIVDKRTDIVQKLCNNVNLCPGISDRDGKTALQHAFEQKDHMVMKTMSAKRSFKEHEEKLNRDRQVYIQALNAILVSAALIASVTFAGWLQLPLDAEFRSLGMKIYWASNSVSFFTAIATMGVTTTALLPTPTLYVQEIVNQLRLAIGIDAGLLAVSLAAVTLAFATTGFEALRHAHIFAYQVIMWTTTIACGLLCTMVWFAFVFQLFHKCSLSTRSVLRAFRANLIGTPFWPSCLPNLQVDNVDGGSSRFGYHCATKSEINDLMNEDLVARRAAISAKNSLHAQTASRTIPLQLTKTNFLAKLHHSIHTHNKERLQRKSKGQQIHSTTRPSGKLNGHIGVASNQQVHAVKQAEKSFFNKE